MNEYQNAFQNAGQNGSFTYNEVGNQSSSFFILILAFILLIALLRSEARYRSLLLRIAGGAPSQGAQKQDCCSGKGCKGG